jgi:acyl carrier protein
VPQGAPGELCISGPQLARGYLHRPHLTADRFLPDPFSPSPGSRLYRTGDLARHRADGSIEFLGRLDDQVKLRGVRVELGEVEAALSRHPGVHQAAAAVHDYGPGDQRLVAYLVPAPGWSEQRLLPLLSAHARSLLPEAMLPSATVLLQHLPLGQNGKLDRRALPPPRTATARVEHVPPRDDRERLLAGVWAEMLRVDRVGAMDDFFSLGGHSLLAVRVVSRIRQETGIELPVAAVFEEPTLAGLARLLTAQGPAAAPAEPPAAASMVTLSDAEMAALLGT